MNFVSRRHRRPHRRALRAVTALVAVATPLACGSDRPRASREGATSVTAGSVLPITASFYPLQFVVEQIGGDLVTVENLTPAGVEPHDVELTGEDIASLQDAVAVFYLAGFSPAVDDAVAAVAGGRAVDVTGSARLDLEAISGDEEGEDAAAGGGDVRNGDDPHFWLDPTRLSEVADLVAERLRVLVPDDAAELAQNAATLRSQLAALDAELKSGLADCSNRAIVTSHTAFGYLAERYGLTQLGISGLSPDEEPSSADVAAAAQFVRDNDVTTIYYETLVDPAVAEIIASEAGSATAVLDPIEGLTDGSAGADYFAVMRSNLATLRRGQGCR
ncbi:MAG: metal ABC transporter substrate-binding protein [Ilumatobacteraceae bacterium]